MYVHKPSRPPKKGTVLSLQYSNNHDFEMNRLISVETTLIASIHCISKRSTGVHTNQPTYSMYKYKLLLVTTK